MRTELLLAAEMLRKASDEFASHGSNDLDRDLIDSVSLADRRRIAEAFNQYNAGGREEEYCMFEYLGDFALMSYLAHYLKMLANAELPEKHALGAS